MPHLPAAAASLPRHGAFFALAHGPSWAVPPSPRQERERAPCQADTAGTEGVAPRVRARDGACRFTVQVGELRRETERLQLDNAQLHKKADVARTQGLNYGRLVRGQAFSVGQYNILAGYLGANTAPWFLYGASVTAQLRARVFEKFYRRDEKSAGRPPRFVAGSGVSFCGGVGRFPRPQAPIHRGDGWEKGGRCFRSPNFVSTKLCVRVAPWSLGKRASCCTAAGRTT